MKQIFVVYTDNGYEGMGEPLRAFSTEALANLFVAGNLYSSPRMVVKLRATIT